MRKKTGRKKSKKKTDILRREGMPVFSYDTYFLAASQLANASISSGFSVSLKGGISTFPFMICAAI